MMKLCLQFDNFIMSTKFLHLLKEMQVTHLTKFWGVEGVSCCYAVPLKVARVVCEATGLS